MKQVRTRGACLADLPIIEYIDKQCFTEAWPVSSYKTEIQHDPCRLYVASLRSHDGSAGRVIAFANFWQVCDEIHIMRIATLPAFRRRGAATALIDRLQQIRGVRALLLEFRATNLEAAALYKGMGFVQIGSRAHYYADGESAVVMQKTAKTAPPKQT